MPDQDIENLTYHDRCYLPKRKSMLFFYHIFHSLLLDRIENPELHNLVKLYQLHRHSRTYRIYIKSEDCRLKLEVSRLKLRFKVFLKRRLVPESFPQIMPERSKILVLLKRNEILAKVKDYTNSFFKL